MEKKLEARRECPFIQDRKLALVPKQETAELRFKQVGSRLVFFLSFFKRSLFKNTNLSVYEVL